MTFQDSDNFDAAIGEVRSLSKEDAVSKLNQLIVKHPRSTPPLVEKMNLMMSELDWEQAMDIANRILTVDSICIPALQVHHQINLFPQIMTIYLMLILIV